MALRIAAPKGTGSSESSSSATSADRFVDRWVTPGGIPVSFHAEPFRAGRRTTDPRDLWLHQEHARLSLLRGFDELLCLEGLHGVEHLPHQIETVRKVLRHFHGRVLLADEVGLGKTIEACLLLARVSAAGHGAAGVDSGAGAARFAVARRIEQQIRPGFYDSAKGRHGRPTRVLDAARPGPGVAGDSRSRRNARRWWRRNPGTW